MNKTGLLFFAFICVFKLNAQYKLYVSPLGNDANTGSEIQPLASLTGARNTIRKLKKSILLKKRQFG